MRVISVAYYALVRPTLVPLIRAGGDVSHAKWFDIVEVAPGPGSISPGEGRRPELAFDHAEILEAALDRLAQHRIAIEVLSLPSAGVLLDQADGFADVL